MSWQTTVTTRTATSKYNFGDVNRVSNNTDYLQQFIDDNFSTTITLPYSFTTKANTDFGTATLINGLENNINTLKTYLGFTPAGWAELLQSWTGAKSTGNGNAYSFVYTNANNLEVDLDLIKDRLDGRVITQDMVRCGVALFPCGKSTPLLF